MAAAELKFKVTVGAGHTNVQLPNGYFYDEGDVVELTAEQYEDLSATAFSSGTLVDGGAASPLTFRDDGETVELVTVESMAVTPDGAAIAGTGTQQLTATLTYGNTDTRVATNDVTWASDATGVATVSATGLVTGVAAGTANVTATYGGVTDTVVITVT